MHRNTKLTEPFRKEVFAKWKAGVTSMRGLAREYHVDKRVIQRVIERGKNGDFSVRRSINKRYMKRKEMREEAVGIRESD